MPLAAGKAPHHCLTAVHGPFDRFCVAVPEAFRLSRLFPIDAEDYFRVDHVSRLRCRRHEFTPLSQHEVETFSPDTVRHVPFLFLSEIPLEQIVKQIVVIHLADCSVWPSPIDGASTKRMFHFPQSAAKFPSSFIWAQS